MTLLLALLSTAITLASAPREPAAPSSHACSAPIPLDLTGPRPVLAIRLANGREARAVFDTGAMASTAALQQAETLGLVNEGPLAPPFDRMRAPGAYQSTFRGLTIGDLPVGDVSVPVMPNPLVGFAGVLSPSIFGDRIVEIDFAASTLRVCDRGRIAELGPGYAYRGEPFPLPALSVTVAGQSFATLIDTGSPLPIAFPMSFAQRFALAEPLTQSGTARGHAGPQPIFKARIRGPVQIGPLTLESPEVRFTDVVPMPHIGMGLLRQLIVTVDPSGRQAWARRAPAAPQGHAS